MKKNKLDLGNADHPYRKSAISIIEQVIEPLLQDKSIPKRVSSHGLDGELYYEVEDKITEIINQFLK